MDRPGGVRLLTTVFLATVLLGAAPVEAAAASPSMSSARADLGAAAPRSAPAPPRQTAPDPGGAGSPLAPSPRGSGARSPAVDDGGSLLRDVFVELGVLVVLLLGALGFGRRLRPKVGS